MEDVSAPFEDPALVTLRNHRPPIGAGALKHASAPPSLILHLIEGPFTEPRAEVPHVEPPGLSKRLSDSCSLSSCSSSNDVNDDVDSQCSDAPSTPDCGFSALPRQVNRVRLTERRGSAPVLTLSDLERLKLKQIKDDSFITDSKSSPRQDTAESIKTQVPELKPVKDVPSYPRANIRRGSLPVEMMGIKRGDFKPSHLPQIHILHGFYSRSNSQEGLQQVKRLPSVPDLPEPQPASIEIKNKISGESKYSPDRIESQSTPTPKEIKRKISGEFKYSSVDHDVKKAISKVGVSSKKDSHSFREWISGLDGEPKKVKRRDLNAWAPNSM